MRPALSRRALLAAPLAAPVLARAQPTKPIRIGVLTDETGPYADSGGAGSVFAARAAVHDFGGTVLGQPIEVLHADTRNKPDVASAIARGWYDGGADLITDLPVTPVAAAVQQVAREKRRSVIITAAAVTEFTAKLCAPISVHWADDTHALAAGTARRVVARGGKTWFFITVDFAFGLGLQKEATEVIAPAGGKVLGAARYPLGNTDYASQLLAAQASGADVIGLASVGNDQVNLIKQAYEFGLVRGDRPTLVAFLVYITDIHALGLPVAKGLTFSSGFYWDQGEPARAFARRFFAARRAMPTRNQAAIYASTLHFLKAMAQAGTRDALAVNQAMRAMPANYLGRPATIRADGRALYDLTLYQVRAPGASKQPWDYYAALATIPAADAFALMTSACAAG
ncbi:MAG: ABC transporter substrate-binding protein [Acetobacteraceae bacterium]|nr:ABC transporter substrate-binding protein [Acetobacteraceae bacterium]